MLAWTIHRYKKCGAQIYTPKSPYANPITAKKGKESKGNVTLALYKTENSYFKSEGEIRASVYFQP